MNPVLHLVLDTADAKIPEGQQPDFDGLEPKLKPSESRIATAIGVVIGLVTPLLGVSVVNIASIPFIQAMALLGVLLGFSGYASVRYLLEQQARRSMLLELTVLRQSDILRRRLELAMRFTGLGWFEMNLEAGTVTWDAKAAEIWGFPEYTEGHTLTLATLLKLLHPEDVSLLKGSWSLPADENINQLEFRILWRDGSQHWLDAEFMHEFNEQGQMIRRMGFVHEITERKAQSLRLEELSKIDALTGLPNRRHLQAIAVEEFDRGKRVGSTCAVAILDIDHFKHINDTFGHAIGDLCLKHLATVFRTDLRKIDTIARLGGEEFVILMPHTDEATAVTALDRLRVVMQNSTLNLDGGTELGFTVSIGVTSQKSNETDFDAILKRADSAMYKAKHMGRNQVRVG